MNRKLLTEAFLNLCAVRDGREAVSQDLIQRIGAHLQQTDVELHALDEAQATINALLATTPRTSRPQQAIAARVMLVELINKIQS